MTSELTKPDSNQRTLAVTDLKTQMAVVQNVMRDVMREKEHFGVIPGCGEKKCLYKSGAEKLAFTFRLRPTFQVTLREYPGEHREYEVKTTITDGNGECIAEGVGCCSTMESKYRYRQAERKCPKCGKSAIIKGKAEYGGGWICFDKKGGCKAKFSDGDKSIEGQGVWRVEHDNPSDYYNTCLKMAKKRSFVDSIITATAASDIFTQDVEESAELQKGTKARTEQKEPEGYDPDLEGPLEEPEPDMGPETEVDIHSEPGVWEGVIRSVTPPAGKGPAKLKAADDKTTFDLWPKDTALLNTFRAAWDQPSGIRRYKIEYIAEQNGKYTNNKVMNVTPIAKVK